MKNIVCFIFPFLFVLATFNKGFAVLDMTKNSEVVLVSLLKDSNYILDARLYRTIYTDNVNMRTPPQICRNDKVITAKYKNISNPCYLDIGILERDGLWVKYSFVTEVGDSVFISSDSNGAIQFSGRGSAKYNLQAAIQKIKPPHDEQSQNFYLSRISNSFPKSEETYFAVLKRTQLILYSNYQKKLKLVNQYQQQISSNVLKIIKSDLMYYYYRESINNNLLYYKYNSSEVQDYLKFIAELRAENKIVYTNKSYLSKEFIEYAIREAQVQQWIMDGRAKEKFGSDVLDKTYQIIDTKYTGYLKDAIKAKFLIEKYKTNGERVIEFMKELEIATVNKPIRAYLASFLSTMAKGAPAFDFALKDTMGNIVRLNDLHGKLTVIDFWYTGCGACKIIAAEMRKAVVPVFHERKDLIFVTISVDENIDTWRNSVKKGDYVKPGGIDLYTNGEGYNHAIVKHYNIGGFPSFVIISKEGKVISTNPPLPWENNQHNQTTNFINYLRNLLDSPDL